jgi:hypothetical protein
MVFDVVAMPFQNFVPKIIFWGGILLASQFFDENPPIRGLPENVG